MGLGKRSLPSRAAGADPHVTFPVVTVSGRHSLMLAVEGRVSGSRVAAPPLLWPSTTGPPRQRLSMVLPAAPPPLCHLGQGKSTLLTLCLSTRPFPPHGALALLAALTV